MPSRTLKLTLPGLRRLIREELRRHDEALLMKRWNSPPGEFYLEVPMLRGFFPGPGDFEKVRQIAGRHGLEATLDTKLRAYKIAGRLQQLMDVEKDLDDADPDWKERLAPKGPLPGREGED